VNQMDQVTQQNAAMVEQTTAAAHSLSQESDELARLLGRFQTGRTRGRADPRQARSAQNGARPALKTLSGKVAAAPFARPSRRLSRTAGRNSDVHFTGL